MVQPKVIDPVADIVGAGGNMSDIALTFIFTNAIYVLEILYGCIFHKKLYTI